MAIETNHSHDKSHVHHKSDPTPTPTDFTPTNEDIATSAPPLVTEQSSADSSDEEHPLDWVDDEGELAVELESDHENAVPVPVSDDVADEVSVQENSAESEDDVVSSEDEEEEEATPETGELIYPDNLVDFRGEKLEDIVTLLQEDDSIIGGATMDSRVRIPGTWENLMYRAINDINREEIRAQDALGSLSEEERSKLSTVLRTEDGKKVLIRTSDLKYQIKDGEKKVLSGDQAVYAFETAEKGGGRKVPLLNSGLTVDIIAPTGVDIQTLVMNLVESERELGSSLGAHYFAYNDLIIKRHIYDFVYPLIVNSSFTDWRKPDRLAAAIKIPDLIHLVMAIASISWPEGFPGFTVKCTRPKDEKFPEQCHHVETFTANLSDMILSRYSAMSAEAIDFIVNARVGKGKNTFVQLAQYQAGLGFEGEVISFGNLKFTMKIPSLAEYFSHGATFLADIQNEVQGDNTGSRYQQVGLRYARSFIPWIASVEISTPNSGSLTTSETKVITRKLEILDKDGTGENIKKFQDYIDKVQLTYVGYPVVPCPACGHVSETKSGLRTLDPFGTFFTLASQRMKTTA